MRTSGNIQEAMRDGGQPHRQAGAPPADQVSKKNIIEQMYEGLQLVSEKELFSIVFQCRKKMEKEIEKEQ